VWIARSRLLPQLSYAETRQNTNQTTTQDTFFGPQVKDFAGQTYNKQISLRQGIIRLRDVEGYRQGHIQARYGEHKLASAKADLWSRSASAWLELLAARALVVAIAFVLVCAFDVYVIVCCACWCVLPLLVDCVFAFTLL
jgi:hypothetical protein